MILRDTNRACYEYDYYICISAKLYLCKMSLFSLIKLITACNGKKVYTYAIHCTWQVVLPEKFCAKQMVLKNVIRTYWGMQKSKMQNHIMCPLRGLVQHRPKNPPNLGRMGCLCQLLSPKGHMIWFLFFHYTFPVAKWVRKYPPCALHKTFLVRCLRKYSDLVKVWRNF